MKTNTLLRVLLFSVLALLCFGNFATAQVDPGYFPNDAIINYNVNVDYAVVGYAKFIDEFYRRNGTSPTVDFVSGGYISGDLLVYNNSTVNIGGGDISGVGTNDSSTVNIRGGNISGVGGGDSSTVNVSGGNIRNLGTDDNNKTFITGGNIKSLSYSIGIPPMPLIDMSILEFSGGNIDGVERGNYSSTYISGGSIKYGLESHDYCTVKISGGNIGSKYVSGMVYASLETYDNSTVDIEGGNFGSDVNVDDNSKVNIKGGTISRDLSAYGGTVNISGGTIGAAYAYSNGTINLSGGMIVSGLDVYDTGTVNIRGGRIGSCISLLNSGTANFYGWGLRSDPIGNGYYLLSGNLSDGTSIDGKRLFVDASGAKFTLNNSGSSPSFLSTLAILSNYIYDDINTFAGYGQYNYIGTNLTFIPAQSDYAGFKAGVYSNSNGQIVIAIRGTNPDFSKALLKNIAADTSFVTNNPSTNLRKTVNYAAALVQSVHNDGRYQNAHITLTGHSLGGAVAELIGAASGFTAVAFNAPGTADLYSKLQTELKPALDLGMCGAVVNYRLDEEQASLVGNQYGFGSTVTLPAPVGLTISGDVLDNLGTMYKLHSMTTMVTQILANVQPITPTSQPNLIPQLQKAVQSNKVYSGVFSFFAKVANFLAILFDPDAGSDYILTANPGSPLFASLSLPTVDEVVAYKVRYKIGTSWSAFQTVQSGVQVTLPQPAVAVEYLPLDAYGKSTTLPDGFYFSASFDSTGDFSGTLTVANALSTVSGLIALDSVLDLSKTNHPVGDITFEFRTPGTKNALFAKTATLTTDATNFGFGDYTLVGVTPGTYDIAIKSRNGLRKVVKNVAITGSTGTIPPVLLLGGDATNDNVVDIGDFGALVNAYNGDMSVPNSGYDPAADFNYDGVVDIADFGILVNNYNLSGDL